MSDNLEFYGLYIFPWPIVYLLTTKQDPGSHGNNGDNFEKKETLINSKWGRGLYHKYWQCLLINSFVEIKLKSYGDFHKSFSMLMLENLSLEKNAYCM